jgi:hypothetical protein
MSPQDRHREEHALLAFARLQVAKPEKDHLQARKAILVNSDVCHRARRAHRPSKRGLLLQERRLRRDALRTQGQRHAAHLLGNLDFKYGDYLLIPRGMIYTLDFTRQDNRLFIVESHRPMYTPKRYRNWFGQLLEHSALLRARHPPAGRSWRRMMRKAEFTREGEEAGHCCTSSSTPRIPSMWWAGTATTTPMPSASTTSSRSPAACTNRHPCTRPSNGCLRGLQRSAHACTTTTQRPSPRPTTTATSTAMRCSTTWTAIS